MGNHGECQPYKHTAGVGLDGLIHKITNISKGFDVGKFFAGLLLALA